jgi:hypothetical protein
MFYTKGETWYAELADKIVVITIGQNHQEG